ncbi:hypothetical protein SELMODRAFT_441224 [Selaginella moellendorffii]|uniref:Uncharacterized protein n=1 Tax=Selaginella moellendorffii TaxID=88036 RepID=D8RHF8_SELML|nr:uncharacterized protein LOC9631959 [Selaginella moellendorffii]EFJ28519.1 hypothetical protein SELMODRAFT_441224 [Selaginella moellendorffii]|eukprot:XP_002970389.1 uncharacterized protein LOC9631959 [Selaginella moellendorffii]
MALRVALGKSFQRGAPATRAFQWRFFSANPETNQPDTDHEHGKMVSEGGGSVSSFNEAKEDVKSKSGGIVEGIKHQVEVEKKNAREMMDEMKEVPKKAGETTEQLKETVVIAGQALKKDAERIAEKVGVRERKPGDLENE